MIRLICVLIAFLIFGCGSTETISSGTEIGNGYVVATAVDKSGSPLANAKVKLLSSEAVPVCLDSVTVGLDGRFSFITNQLNVSILITTDTSSYFQNDISPASVQGKFDTVTAVPYGSVELVLDDTTGFADSLFVQGTGIGKALSSAIQNNGKWIITFDRVPAMQSGSVVMKTVNATVELSDSFTVTSGTVVSVLAGIYWHTYELPAFPGVVICPTDSGLFWGGSSEIRKFQNGKPIESYLSQGDFSFANLSAMTFNRRGELWVGTSDGRFGFILSQNNFGMLPTAVAQSSIVSLSVQKDSSYWFAVNSGGIIRIKNSIADTILSTVPFSTIIEDSSNGIWALGVSNTIYHIPNTLSENAIPWNEGTSGTVVKDMEFDGSGGVWILTDTDLIQLHSDGTKEIAKVNGVDVSQITSIAVNKTGLWVCTSTALYLIHENFAHAIDWDGVPFQGDLIETIAADFNGSVWVETSQNMYEVFKF